jgi:hypothetical protein
LSNFIGNQDNEGVFKGIIVKGIEKLGYE